MTNDEEQAMRHALRDIIVAQDAHIARQGKEIERLLKEIARQQHQLERQHRALEEGWQALTALPFRVDNRLTFAAACASIKAIWDDVIERLEQAGQDTAKMREHWRVERVRRENLEREIDRIRQLDADAPVARRPRSVPDP